MKEGQNNDTISVLTVENRLWIRQSQCIWRLLFSTAWSLNIAFHNYVTIIICWRKTYQLASQIMLGVFLPCWSLNWPVLGSTACFLREECSWQSFLRAERNSSSFLQAWTVLKATWRVTDGLATTQWAEWAWIAQGSFDIQNIRKTQ